MKNEVKNWIKQARADFRSAENSLNSKDYYLSAFMSQQAAEKSLKALYIQNNQELLKTHSVSKLGKMNRVPESILNRLGLLDPIYTETRYPDISSRIPSEEFDENDAKEIFNLSQEVLEWVEKRL